MKMVIKASIANFKYNRGRNILVGIAVCLTTLLLFLVPGAAQAMVKLEFAAINEIYPTWHVVLRNVDSDIAEQVRVREDVETVGLRCDVGMIPADQATISLTALDQKMCIRDRDIIAPTTQEKERYSVNTHNTFRDT